MENPDFETPRGTIPHQPSADAVFVRRVLIAVLVIGLMLSVALMGLAASFVAKLLNRYPWISYAGIFIVLFVALRMIWTGSMLVLQAA